MGEWAVRMQGKEALSLAFRSSLMYLIFTLLFSLLAFLYPLRGGPSFPSDICIPCELAKNAIIGLGTGLFSFNLTMILTATAFTTLIDADHIPQFLGFNVYGRPAHSIIFIVLSSVLIALLSRKRRNEALASGLITASAGLSHLALDTFAGGPVFPLFMPLAGVEVILPDSIWILFQTIAILLAFISGIQIRKSTALVWKLDRSS